MVLPSIRIERSRIGASAIPSMIVRAADEERRRRLLRVAVGQRGSGEKASGHKADESASYDAHVVLPEQIFLPHYCSPDRASAKSGNDGAGRSFVRMSLALHVGYW